MKKIFSKPVGLLFVGALSATLAFAAGGRALADDFDGKLHVGLTPYVWLPTFNGNLNFTLPSAPNSTIGATVGPNSYLSNLNFAFMVAGEVRKGKLSLTGDIINLNLSSDRTSVRSFSGPGGEVVVPLQFDGSTRLTGTLVTVGAGYTLLHCSNSNLDAFAGARYAGMSAGVGWNLTGPAGTFPRMGNVSRSLGLTDGIVGLRGKFGLGDGGFFIPYYADVGTGATQLTYQGILGAGFGFGWGNLQVVWRHLSYDMGTSGALDNVRLDGPALGATFKI
ncbi:MAG TPA: hypothetical protein VKG44_10225 [Candidatus Baltobacteraceae bacterium]|nr:hypothetical protein [Candidatus Baltobacteraceae bacterium]